MSHIVIVGRKFSELADRLTQSGDTYTLLQDVKKTKFPDKKFRRRIVADFSSNESLLATVKTLHDNDPIDAVISLYENYILPTAIIGEFLGVPHLPVASAEACTDKFLMRTLFNGASEKISPDFAIVQSIDDVLAFAHSHSFPLILKPANLAKSLLVTKSSDITELRNNYEKTMTMIDKIYETYAPNRTPKLIVEEFLEGSIHSVDAYIGEDGIPLVLDNVVDYQTGYDIGYDDNFHYSRILPSKLSANDQIALRHCAEIGIKALGMKNSPAHVEVIMTVDGPRIVEIGARNGGYRGRMHRLANGIDILGAAIEVALGKKPSIIALKNEPCAVLELFPKHPGIYMGIHNESTLRSLSSLEYLSIKATPGRFVGKAGDGYKMCTVVILHNTDQAKFDKDILTMQNDIFIDTTS
ncbi:MAG: ATP-grasp domain-containing protein [Candidatus Saccharimonadales bacterium]